MRSLLLAAAMLVTAPISAQAVDLEAIVQDHVLPRYANLAAETQQLAATAAADCTPDNAALTQAYHSAFDAWIGVSHLRFGPSEQEDRAFALAFWPDPRGATPKTLAALLREADPVVETPQAFATVSVAARGFYALEFLLFDPQFTETDDVAYHCALVQAVTADIATNAAAIFTAWDQGYGDLIATAGNDTYRTETEAAQQFFTALTTGLEFTSSMRLGRPLGTFERSRPNRAEARRSGRSLRHVVLALDATAELAALISDTNDAVSRDFARALERATALEDPVFAGVADPGSRFRVEALQNSVVTIYRTLLEDVGPGLGITAGFNSLDGD
ncbi:MAG: imelysin family protein [Pseudomonadota bacterium]